MSDLIAPHPLGAQLGPAALRERRRDPLLAGEIIVLLERHGVPWEQAVREAAGLMGQTIREAEGWWAFEVSDIDNANLTEEQMIAEKRASVSSSRPAVPDPRADPQNATTGERRND